MQHEPIQALYEFCEKNRELTDKIFVAVPVRPHDGVAVQLNKAMMVWFAAGIMSDTMEDSMGGFVEIMRCRIARTFLDDPRDFEYLLMIDNDTEPPIDLPLLLARHREPVVGSCVVSLNRKGRRMLCFSRADLDGNNRFVDFDGGQPVPATGLAEVPHCGTGAMMIRRDVLESFSWEGDDVPFMVPQDIRLEGARTGYMGQGEDIAFCKQVRDRGFKVQVDMEAHCGHRKTMRLAFPPELRDPSLSVDDWIAPVEGVVIQSD